MEVQSLRCRLKKKQWQWLTVYSFKYLSSIIFLWVALLVVTKFFQLEKWENHLGRGTKKKLYSVNGLSIVIISILSKLPVSMKCYRCYTYISFLAKCHMHGKTCPHPWACPHIPHKTWCWNNEKYNKYRKNKVHKTMKCHAAL